MPSWSIEKIIRIIEVALNVLLYACKALGFDMNNSESEKQ